MKTTENTEIRNTASGLPPEDLAFLSGVLQALTAMYCRLHPVQTEPREEEHHEQ